MYIDSECRYLKFLLTQNYKNSLNIFNQVGILSLTCFGELGFEPTTTQAASSLLEMRSLWTPLAGSQEGIYFGGTKLTRQSRVLESMFEDKLRAIETKAKRAV